VDHGGTEHIGLIRPQEDSSIRRVPATISASDAR